MCAAFTALARIDLRFDLKPDEKAGNRYPGFIVIAGRNGSGKTTLLRAAATALAGPEVIISLTEGMPGWISHGRDEGTAGVSVVSGGDENGPSPHDLRRTTGLASGGPTRASGGAVGVHGGPATDVDPGSPGMPVSRSGSTR